MADDNKKLSEESQKKIEKFDDELGKISQRIIDLGSDLDVNLAGKLQNAVNAARRLSDPLQSAADITSQLNKLADKNETLIIQRKVAEDNYVKALQSGIEADKQAAEDQFRKIAAQLKIQQGLEDQLRSLQGIAEEEKRITEEKKKQNSLLGALKTKFADQLKTLKEMFTLGSIIDMLFKGSENIANFRKELGMSYGDAYKLNTELSHVGSNVADAYINGEKLKKAFTDLSKEMGFVADYGAQSLVTMTNLTGRLGMSNKEAAQLTTLSRFQSQDTEKVLNNVGKTVSSMNKQKGTSILLKDVMRDIGNVSMATAVSLGKNPVAIAQAVVAAKQLGTTLEQMEKTADSLLNFESSIENELKAELLTGKQMNLERARAAALSNDMKTLSEEIGKNQDVINSFAKGNRIEQQAIAESLGMSREDLAKMIYQQEAMKIGAEGVRAKYGEQAYEQLKAQNAQEKFTNAIEKLKSALSGVVQIFSPILDALATVGEYVSIIFSKWYILYPILIGAALLYIPKIAKGFMGMASSVKNMAKDAMKLFSKDGIKSLLSGSAGGGIEDKTKEAAEKTAGTGDKVGGGNAAGFKEKMQNIAEGIKAFGNVKVLFGAINLIPSSIGLIAMIPGILGAKLIEKINGEKFQESMYGLAYGLEAMGKGKVLLGSLALVTTSIGLIAMIPGVLGAKLIEQINGGKLQESLQGLASGLAAMGTGKVFLGSLALIAASAGLIAIIPGVLGGVLLGATGKLINTGLRLLASGLQSFGQAAMNPMTWAGVGLLAAFNIALIPLGYTLNLMAPAIETFGKAIKSAFEGIATVITAAANGISTIFTSLQNVDVAKLLAIGPALTLIGVGLASLGAGGAIAAIGALAGDPIKRIERLAAAGTGLQAAATGLQGVAAALTQVASALSVIDVSKLEALEGFATKMTIGSVVKGITDFITAPIKAIGENIGGTTPDNTPMVKAINEVRDAVNKLYAKNTTVNIDSKQVNNSARQRSTQTA